jgi:CoA-transferase family III
MLTGPESPFLPAIWQALGGAPAALDRVRVDDLDRLPSVFAVSELAVASVAAAGLAMSEWIAAGRGVGPEVRVSQRLASMWFATSLRPIGWAVPPAWDPVAGDYRSRDGWIRLHTNAPAHRTAALRVLGAAAGEVSRATLAPRVAAWDGAELEAAVVAAGGCAAQMRSASEWAAHPQGAAVSGEPLVAWEASAAATQALPRPANAPGSGQGGGQGDAPGDAGDAPSEAPLAGVRVLDLTRVLAGPVATRFLAGFGADVLRIDPPAWDEPALAPEVTLGKRCARLDLRQTADRATFEALLAQAHVLVHGLRPGALDALGFGAEHPVRAGLVDVSLDAYGFNGPWRGRRGFDSLVQMSAGIAEAGMHRYHRDTPQPLPVQALDQAAGYLLAAAAMQGLSRQRATGLASRARTSLARMALLLVEGPDSGNTETAIAEAPRDLVQAVEATAWGPARRLRPPLDVAGYPMRWHLAAGLLGASDARFITAESTARSA